MSELLQLKQQEFLLLNEKLRLKEELPHLYGFQWYKWAYEYFTSTNRKCFLTAGNQLSKSSSQIRKCIDWATSPEKWQVLWPGTGVSPNVFWYFYPTSDVAEEEWQLKWSQFMPNGRMKEDPVYGWKEYRKNNKIYSIEFNSGVTVIFKTYAQSATDIQTGTVYAVFCDEEVPLSHWPEIQSRLNATDGYVSMVFTATLGQEYWRKTIEGEGSEELHPDADKWQVTLFDCLEYIDGSPSPWSFDKVKRACARAAGDPVVQADISACESIHALKALVLGVQDTEIQRRILGRFVYVGGLKFETFRRTRNTVKIHPLPSNWLVYGSVDYGSGGSDNHPAAISFLGVSPDFKMGRIFRCRRMDGVLTTAQDVLDEYIKIRGTLTPVMQTYDWSSKDFHTFADRRGEPFLKAQKDQEWGVTTMNTLFKSGMLKIMVDKDGEITDDGIELEKLVTEICSLKATTNKRDAKDDLCDTVRYNVMSVPWDWSVLDEEVIDEVSRLKQPIKAPPKNEIDLRREFIFGESREENHYTELDEWNDLINEFDS